MFNTFRTLVLGTVPIGHDRSIDPDWIDESN